MNETFLRLTDSNGHDIVVNTSLLIYFRKYGSDALLTELHFSGGETVLVKMDFDSFADILPIKNYIYE